MVVAFLLFAVAVIRLHPDTPAARWLHEGLVERPLAELARMERRHWIALVVLVGLAFAGVAGVTGELAWMLALDSSIYVDLMIALWTASVLRGVRGVRSAIRSKFDAGQAAVVRTFRPRQKRDRSSRPCEPPANDDGDVRHAA